MLKNGVVIIKKKKKMQNWNHIFELADAAESFTVLEKLRQNK